MTLGLDLDALAALERAATPGEWLVALNGSAETCLRFIWRNDYGGNLSPEGRNVGATRVARDFHEKDAALTAALRNAAPQLIAAARESERLRADLEEMRRLYEHRGEALRRPCIHCGYQPKEIRAALRPPGDGGDKASGGGAGEEG